MAQSIPVRPGNVSRPPVPRSVEAPVRPSGPTVESLIDDFAVGRSTFIYLVLILVTFGMYTAIWFMIVARRLRKWNKQDSIVVWSLILVTVVEWSFLITQSLDSTMLQYDADYRLGSIFFFFLLCVSSIVLAVCNVRVYKSYMESLGKFVRFSYAGIIIFPTIYPYFVIRRNLLNDFQKDQGSGLVDITAQLERLVVLKNQGALTSAEFEAQKKKLLE
jgi:hypothetical protein